jgi:hypothetical protein
MNTPTVRLKLKDVFKSFQIDLRGFYKNRVYVQHHLHIQPSEIDCICYYEYQWMVKDLKMDKMKSNASKYTKGFGGSNMPKMGNFKMPKM